MSINKNKLYEDLVMLKNDEWIRIISSGVVHVAFITRPNSLYVLLKHHPQSFGSTAFIYKSYQLRELIAEIESW